ncbi:MAG TPA: hypothetical protein VK388_07000 [Pyrinomonadaceae bacterium]|nr:hypothetical protein [Pyrinomonadaceae bacterium]
MFKRIAIAILLVVSMAVASVFPIGRANAANAPKCKQVRGHAISHTVSGSECASPIGLCAGGQLYGGIKGELFLVATSLAPTQDTPVTGVYIYTADDVIRTKTGDIYTKDAGALNLTPNSTGDDLSIAVITGGTGDYAGATGALRIYGTFSETSGEFNYEGQICTP